jgi:hypothetical protein
LRPARARIRAAILAWQRAEVVPTLIALYALATAVLLLPWPFGAHPPWAYNWEGYTAWRWATYWEPPAGPALALWAPNDGLMTDSGQGPLVGLPVSIGVVFGGLQVAAMRLPVALLAAAAPPLLWLLGRRVAGPGPALLAALLLATSPAFLFYGRTATLVGVSLVPLLLIALALARVLDADPAEGWRWRREGVLAGSLLLGIYAYAPVRLLWPLAVALLCFAALRQRARRRVLLGTALSCLLVVPLGVMLLEQLTAPAPDPVAAASGYFHARGEQLVAMAGEPAAAGQYIRDPSGDAAAGEPALRLIGQNVADLIRLLLDRDTGPVVIDYWNERGRLWPWFFLPFAMLGIGKAARDWRRQGRIVCLLPLALAVGLALPLLLTSRVHIGRLLPTLPFALLLVAAGAWFLAVWLAQLSRRTSLAPGDARRVITPLLAGLLLIPAVLGSRADLTVPLDPTRETRTAAAMADWTDDVRERGSAILVEDPALGDEIEGVHAATYRLDLDQTFRFVDLHQPGTTDQSADPRPPLFWRGALGLLQDGAIARPCERLWFVAPEIADTFLSAWHAAGCNGAPDSVILP